MTFKCVCKSSRSHIQNGAVAVVAAWREQVMVVLLAVWLTVALKEVSRTDLILAVCAYEMLRVPCAAHGCYHLCEHIRHINHWLTQLRSQQSSQK